MRSLLFGLFFRVQHLLAEEAGQDLVEYALVVALVGFGATSALKVLGTGLNHAFSAISSTLSSSLA